MFEYIPFKPLPGLSSPHAQTIVASFTRPGITPPSNPLLVPLKDGDAIFCEVSQPLDWVENKKTIVMVHGLAGSTTSNYMVRIARKLFEAGYRVVRVNLRGSGQGSHLARLPYHGGSSGDVLAVLQHLKELTPYSPFVLVGFSLGGNIALKLSGELDSDCTSLLESTIAICSPIDLEETIHLLAKPANKLYQRFYLGQMLQQTQRWTKGREISSLYEYDSLITAPIWGFSSAEAYYRHSSSRYYLPNIKHPCYVLLTEDDPFVDHRQLMSCPLPSNIKVALCQNGGHMGFLGWTGMEHRHFWLDQHLLNWIDNN
ncbi:MAG: alpha/beta fold hydrolase [Parachlamydiaceae bacterium]|nr:alpha/beta fold hydrolase [Parachlamydiaceae bacterium]